MSDLEHTAEGVHLGLDFPVHSTLAILRNEALEFWEYLFSHTGTDTRGFGSYTCELHLLEDVRVLFTADPENTKAILTQQFQDFGKGKLHGVFQAGPCSRPIQEKGSTKNGNSSWETAFSRPTASSGIIHDSSFDPCSSANESPIFRSLKLMCGS